MATDKQKLAKARNYFKYVLSGIPKPIQLNYLTEEEKRAWMIILNTRDRLIANFDARSKEMGLTVVPKCWCGKVGKYKLTGVNTDRLLCKEHRDDN